MNNQATYEKVSNQIITAMESAGSWENPFKAIADHGMPHNVSSGKNYSGINVLTLWAAGIEGGFGSNQWGTFKQWKDKGNPIRKGQKSCATIIFFKKIDIKDKATGEDKKIPLLRSTAVFNAEQTQNGTAVENHVTGEALPDCDPVESLANEAGANVVRITTGKAFYVPSVDVINIQKPELMKSLDDYRATLAHELGHWTGHKNRLDRFKDGYAFEELIAELSAAFTCARLGVSKGKIENHASYLNSWVKQIKDDPKTIFKACSEAQKATNFLFDCAE